MAVQFSKTVDGVTYEVRTAGRSIRLYTSGAFHSQYHPDYLFTGAVWDLLTLPTLCLQTPPQRILVLGVAGGTAIHQLQQLHQPEAITGIELDGMHMKLARQYFHLNYPNLELINAEASRWLQSSKQCFDVIIDDIFLHGADDPERPFDAGRDWFRQLREHLSPNGVIIQNHIGAGDAFRAARHFGASQRKKGTVMGFSTAGYENCVVAWFNSRSDPHSQRRLTRQLQARLDEMPRRETRRLRHRIKTIRE